MSFSEVLHDRRLIALWASGLVSDLGTQMSRIALAWFVLVGTGSASKMGLTLAATVLPAALVGIHAGRVVERVGAVRSMLWADLICCPLLASIPLLEYSGLLSFPLLLGLVFFLGVFAAPYRAAQRLAMTELVGDDVRRVAQGNTLLDTALRSAVFVGPLLAGPLVAWLDAPAVLLIDAGSFLASALILMPLASVHRPRRIEAPQGALAGLSLVARDGLLRTIALTTLIGGVLTAAIIATLPVLSLEGYGQGAAVVGLLIASLGAGTLAGSALGFVVVSRLEPLRLSGIALAGVALALWPLAAAPPIPLAMAALFVSGVFSSLLNAPILTLLTLQVPVGLRPQVMTAIFSLSAAAAPFGYVAAGPALAAAAPETILVVIAALFTLLALVFWVATREARNLSPLGLPRSRTSRS